MNERRIVVIGGGPAGLLAAGRAAEKGARVVLVEKNQALGEKLLISGKKRCNLTSSEEDTNVFLSKYGPNGKFLYSAFSGFGPRETIEFFESRGVHLVEERGKRMFPAKGGSEAVLSALLGYLREGRVAVCRERESLNLEIGNGRVRRFILREHEIEGDAFIVCTGGKSFPKTGSTGDGYRFARRAGHTVIPPLPALCPVRTIEKWPLSSCGLTLRNVSLTLRRGGTILSQRFGELLLTHFGISGPIAMDMSKEIAGAAERGKVMLSIDFKPALPLNVLADRISRDFVKFSGRMFKDSLGELLPRGLIPAVLRLAPFPVEKIVNSLSRKEIEETASLFKTFPLTPDGLLGFEWAIVTSGGVSLKEIEPATMRSKLVENLFFAGEVLDLDGPTGGFNLQMCWSTGYRAGESAADMILSA
jgi:hypothetical protein